LLFDVKILTVITVPQATEKIIKRSRYLSEAMGKDLINAASLARYIQPEVEEMTFKKVTPASIMMAIKRLRTAFITHGQSVPLFTEAPDMIVRSNLTLWYIKNSPLLFRKLVTLDEASASYQKKALFTYGRAETIILANKLLSAEVEKILKNEVINRTDEQVSAITIHLPEGAIDHPGIYNYFLKSLAWEGISLLGVLSTQTELTLVFPTKKVIQHLVSFSRSLLGNLLSY
jgi:hypothetical protein